MNKIFGCLVSILLIGLVSPKYIQAAEFREPDTDDGNIVISQDELVKNLYTGGNLVSIDADVQKGLVVAGNFITIKGNVEDNLIAGGGTVTVRGNIGGTAYVGGGNVIIEGAIEDDLFVGGGTVTIAESASIGGDLIIGGGVANIYGPVAGNILLGAGQATIDNKVGGYVKAEVEALSLGEKADVIGDITYKSPNELVMNEGATVSGILSFSQISSKNGDKSFANSEGPSKETVFKIIFFGLSVKLAITMTSALVLVYFFKKSVSKVVDQTFTNFWSNFGMGFATLILTPFLAFMLLMTFIGAGLSGLMMISYILIVTLSSAIASIAFGSWIMKVFGKTSKYVVDWKSTFLGVLILVLLMLVQPVGWMTSFIFTTAGLGTLLKMFLERTNKERN